MDVQAFFQGLSEIFAAGRIDEVRGYLQKSLAEAEAQDDHHAAVTVLNEMIGYFRSISSYKDAIWASERAITQMQALGYEGTVAYGTTLLNAATAFRASGDDQKALALYEETLTIYQRCLPENDPQLAGLYNNISSLCQAGGEYEKAYTLLQKSLAILSQTEGAAIDAATVHTNCALALFALDREPEALQALRTALDIFEEDEDGGSPAASRRAPHYAAALAGLGAAYYRLKQYDMAVQVYESALSHIKACFGENRDFAVTRKNCAVVLDAMGQHEKAQAYRDSADALLARIAAQ